MILKKYLDNRHTKGEQSNLTYLQCLNGGITSLEGIENLDKLEYLDCRGNKLTSLKGIENLDKLRYLNCNNNPLPYSDLGNLDKIKLEVIKEVRQYKIQKLLLL